MSDIDDLTPEEALAESLVDEAMAGMMVPPSLYKTIRVLLIGELLTTPEGQAQLRRAAADPKVARSGDVAKPGAPKAKTKAVAGGGSARKRGTRGGGSK